MEATAVPRRAQQRIGQEQRKRLEQHMATMCASPRIEHVALLAGDVPGTLRKVSRLEARDRGWPVYVGALCTLTKPFALEGGGWGTVRFTANGNSVGQQKLQQLITKE